ncbi:hypothetical protein MXE01_15590, partial [Legionella pneumophila]|nr:hypothetical protein [Legionella pneumophila]
MVQVWENHTHYEFDTKNVADTMKTMEDNPYVNNIPTMIGGFGQEEVKQKRLKEERHYLGNYLIEVQSVVYCNSIFQVIPFMQFIKD